MGVNEEQRLDACLFFFWLLVEDAIFGVITRIIKRPLPLGHFIHFLTPGIGAAFGLTGSESDKGYRGTDQDEYFFHSLLLPMEFEWHFLTGSHKATNPGETFRQMLDAL
ncbi:hypothetical protein GCM10027180_02940 [Microbulbifer echini]